MYWCYPSLAIGLKGDMGISSNLVAFYCWLTQKSFSRVLVVYGWPENWAEVLVWVLSGHGRVVCSLVLASMSW